MFNVTKLRKVYTEKLRETDNQDDAFVKAVWTAYQMGVFEAGGEVSDKFKREILGEKT